MEEGRKEAFCLILWGSTGGEITNDGRPVAGPNQFARGLCTRPYDCDTCQYMQAALTQYDPQIVTWVCPLCVQVIMAWRKQYEIEVKIPGYFSEGECQYPWCENPGMPEFGLPPKYSVFRNLIIGAIR